MESEEFVFPSAKRKYFLPYVINVLTHHPGANPKLLHFSSNLHFHTVKIPNGKSGLIPQTKVDDMPAVTTSCNQGKQI